MKKIVLFAAAGVMLGTMTSCLGNSGENTQTYTYTPKAYTMIGSADGKVEVSTESKYTITAELYSSKATINGEGLIFGSMPFSFSTKEIAFGQGALDNIYPFMVIGGIKQTGNVALDGNPSITDLRADYTYASMTNVASIKETLKAVLEKNPLNRPMSEGNITPYLSMQFKYNNDYQVKTFWPDMIYSGKTITTDNRNTTGGPFETDKIYYRLVMNFAQSGGYKADLYFYNAKFSDNEKAPTLNFVLKNLDLKFTANAGDCGFTVTGKDVEPISVMDGTPYPNYKFDAVNILSFGDLNSMVCRYQIGGGKFSGTLEKGVCLELPAVNSAN